MNNINKKISVLVIMSITQIKSITVQTVDAHGGRGKMWQLFGSEMETIINELNEALAA